MSPIHSRSAVGIATLLVAACATGPTNPTEWRDPALGTQSHLLKGSSVLVACDAPDIATRTICQQQLAADVRARGGVPVMAPTDIAVLRDREFDPQLLAASRSANARTLLVMALTPVAINDGPAFSIGIGGFGFGRNSAIGGGVSAPIGSDRITTGFAASGRITDVASGKLLWTAREAPPPTGDLRGHMADLSAAVLDSAQRAGLF